MSRLAVSPHVPLRLLDDAVDGGEAEPSALTDALGGKERIESAVQGGGVHALPRVAHREQHVWSGAHENVGLEAGVFLSQGDLAGLHGQPPAVGHRIPGVEREIEQHLLDLASVRADRFDRGSWTQLQDAIFAQSATEHRSKVAHDRIEIDRLGPQDLAPTEGKQLGRDRGGPLARPA